MVTELSSPELMSIESLRARGVSVVGEDFIRSPLPVSELATRSISLLALAVSTLSRHLGYSGTNNIHVDRGLCDAWFGLQVRPVGWKAPSPWDPLSSTFETRDHSWVRSHANAPLHRRALLAVLGCDSSIESADLARAIKGWRALELEEAIVDAGGVAAAFRSLDEWRASPAGQNVENEELIGVEEGEEWDGHSRWEPSPAKPLAGLRVLDLTRVIAGPACTQVLAGLGADVLRIDPPEWDEPAVMPLVMWGKRSARLDAKAPPGRERLAELLAGADVLVHGYRSGAIDKLGLSVEERRRIRPGLIDVGERAYGWTGPWADKRGFDSIVQFATGIAHVGMVRTAAGNPVSLPVQALDWATGYLAATAVVTGLTHRMAANRGSAWRLSLARTAHELHSLAPASEPVSQVDVPPQLPGRVFASPRGEMFLASSPFRVGKASLEFERVTTRLGQDEPLWL